MGDQPRWVVDTSCYTHLCRAGHADILSELAPQGVVVVPSEVNDEIEAGRDAYASIPAVSSVAWATVAVLSEEEKWTLLEIKAALGGGPSQHVGECAVIACAHHRGHVAILDDRAAIEQAKLRGVETYTTLWLVIEAYKTILGRDRVRTAQIVDGLLATGMWLTIRSGESLITWAYEEGLLP